MTTEGTCGLLCLPAIIACILTVWSSIIIIVFWQVYIMQINLRAGVILEHIVVHNVTISCLLLCRYPTELDFCPRSTCQLYTTWLCTKQLSCGHFWVVHLITALLIYMINSFTGFSYQIAVGICSSVAICTTLTLIFIVIVRIYINRRQKNIMMVQGEDVTQNEM